MVLSHVDDGAGVNLKVNVDVGAVDEVLRLQILDGLQLPGPQLDDRPAHEVRRVVRLVLERHRDRR